jgi:hypothetical protein
MSTSVNGARLAALSKDLLGHWRQTREQWPDHKAREFEDRFISELESAVNSALSGIADLERIISKVRSDCE